MKKWTVQEQLALGAEINDAYLVLYYEKNDAPLNAIERRVREIEDVAVRQKALDTIAFARRKAAAAPDHYEDFEDEVVGSDPP